jgi:hypothetical protein
MRRRQVSKTQTTSVARRVINAATAIPPPVVAKTYFLPTAIPGCQLWLDAADSSSVITTGTNVTGWNDKSGNGYHMNMLTPNASWTGTAVYPTIGTSINGLQTVNFNAQAGLKQSTTLDGVKNLFWVGRIAAPVGSGANFYYLLGHDSLYEWTGQAYGGKFIDVGFSPSGITGASPASLFTSDANAITNTTFSNVSMPSAPNVSLLSVAGITGSTRFQGICYDRDAHIGWCGDLAEVITFTTALNTAQRQAVEGYLAHKWGLTTYYSPSFPLSISGCQLWLDGADTSSMTLSGSSVTQWRDKSENGRNGTAVGTTPTFASGGGITFSAGAYNTSYSSSSTNESLFVVFRYTKTSGTLSLLGQSGDGGRLLAIGGGASTGRLESSVYNVAFGSVSENTTVPINTIGLGELITTNSSMVVFYNGTSVGTPTAVSFTAGRTSIIGGASNAGSINTGQYFEGIIYEVIGFTSALTTTQRQQVEGYLARKWGIVIKESFLTTHPYANFIPSPLARFAPTNIAGSQLWLDGADPLATGTPPANGSAISIWNDKSGNSRNATVASGRVAGTYSSSLRAVNFATSSTGYGTTYSANPTNETMFVVFNNATPSSLNNILIGGQGGARSLGAGYTASGTGYVGNLNNGIVWLANTSPYTSGTTALVTSDFTSSTNSVSLNGGTAVSGGAPGFTSGTTTFIGVDTRDLGYYYVGHAMEIIFFNSVLTTNQRQQVEGYLALKWGLTGSLPSGHPYKSFSPFPVSLFNFLPTMVSGCGLWLDGADTSSASMSLTGSTLNTWKDKSGNGYNFTKAFSSSPTISNLGTGTAPYFDANQGLYNTTIPFPKTYTIFSVANLTGLPPYHCYIMHSPYNADFIIFFGAYVRDFATFAGPVGSWNDTNANSPTSTIASTSTTASLLCCTNDGTTLRPYFNGTTLDTKVGTNASATGMFIGDTYVNPSGQHWRGAIAEFIVYNKVLSTTERQQVESYLAWKWGLQASLPSDHTYKFAPPSV